MSQFPLGLALNSAGTRAYVTNFQFDRFSGIGGTTDAVTVIDIASTRPPALATPLARYWVDRSEVEHAVGSNSHRGWLSGWRKITNAGVVRTFVPFVLPHAAAGDSCLLWFPGDDAGGPQLLSAMSSIIFDNVARQKLSGSNMQYFILKQIACPTPRFFQEPTEWCRNASLSDWISPYMLELGYTSWRLKSYAEDMGDDGPPFRTAPDRRALLQADLDAVSMAELMSPLVAR